jgi:solute carrier family 35 protein C2
MLLTITIISLGVFVTVASEINEIHFDAGGYLKVQFATIFSGLRWSLTQILLERESIGMNNPLATSLFLSPVVSLTLFMAFLVMEGFDALFSSTFFQSSGQILNILGIIGIGGTLAFLMNIAEFKLIASTSVVTFTVAGIVKEILTIAIASVVFNDKITIVKLVGVSISIVGIIMYNWIRIYEF